MGARRWMAFLAAACFAAGCSSDESSSSPGGTGGSAASGSGGSGGSGGAAGSTGGTAGSPIGGSAGLGGNATGGSGGGASDTPDYEDPVAGVTLLGGRTTSNVSNTSELQTALTSAPCGTDVVMASGSYGGSLSFDRSCPANNPVILRGSGPPSWSADITGMLVMTGTHNIVTGVDFSAGTVRLEGTNNKVIGNRFSNWSAPGAVQPNGGSFGEIAYNDIGNPAPFDATSCPAPTTQFRMAVKMFTEGDGGEESVHTDVWMHHNHVHDLLQKPCPTQFASAQADAAEPGESNYDWTPTFRCGWYMEHNLLEDLPQTGGGAAYDLKCGYMVVRYETLINVAASRIDIRFGSNTIIESNWFEGGGATHVHGGFNKVVCNRYNGGSGIRVLAGDRPYDSSDNAHPAAHATLVAGNSGDLHLGDPANAASTVEASDTTIEEHDGNVIFELETGTVDHRDDPSTYKCLPAVAYTVSDVGPAAIDAASGDYRAARGL